MLGGGVQCVAALLTGNPTGGPDETDVPRVATVVVVGSGALMVVIDIVPGIVGPPSPTSRLTSVRPPLEIPLAVHSRTRQFASVLASEVLPAPRSPTTITRGPGTSSSGIDRSAGLEAVYEEGRARIRSLASERWSESHDEKVDSDAT